MMSMEYFRKNGKENFKILKSVWEVIKDYLVILLAMIAVLVAGMEVTSGSFECVPVVNCRNIANNISNASWPQANLKFSSICRKYYRSQTTSFAERTEVVTDQNINCLYKSFVNSECSKSVIPNYLAYLWIVLFAEALLLFILDNFWLKIPLTSSVIETFVDLVMTCYDSPCPNFEVTFALFQSNYKKTSGYVSIPNDGTPNLNDEFYNLDSLPDSTTTSALKGLYEKVQTLAQNLAIASQCHNFTSLNQKCAFKLPQQSFDQLSDIDPICGDLGFLLHLLDSYNKMYVIRFAHFLSKENRKKIDAHTFNIKFPISLLQATVEKEQKLSFSTLPGIPQTIFHHLVCQNLVHLTFSDCRFHPDDFENFNKLTYLKDLSMLDCHLTSIPKGIFVLEWLENLHLSRNLIKKIDVEISALKMIKFLTLDNNKLQTIAPNSLTQLENLESLNIDFNHELEMDALREVLACRNLSHLECPFHLKERVDELNETEKEKLNNLNPKKTGHRRVRGG
ncbi:volume-regulated anion channel subunit LRRC8E-like [Xenia sp. Carnegie-2017]|uniref:volume-regulated anion channel subunit LRRC8E-like n=1 Tax=Xenia sp. Carnegie-2017 TaxID=2897299 RepID=UPI001F03BD33|nr:volume-regulated anion channel subunit LRRC8E-like [Xenia sp. Carnegie-2017]